MAAGPGQDRTLAPLPAPGLAASLKLLLLRLAPFSIALVNEPWAAAATAAVVLRRKLRRADYALDHAAAEAAAMRRQVLTAATWLLGVCVLIIVALKITDQNARTWADEAAWVAGGFMTLSIVLSRSGRAAAAERLWQSGLADWSFLIGSAAVLASLLFSLSLL